MRRDSSTSRLLRKLAIRVCVRIVFLLAGASGLYGDDVAGSIVSGRVALRGGQPVQAARVTLRRAPAALPAGDPAAGRVARTGEDGAFAFDGVPPGDYRLCVEAVGIRPQDLGGLVTRAGGALRLEIEVEPALTERLSVGGVPGAGGGQGLSHAILKRADLAAGPASLGDPLRALAGLPGLSTDSDLKSEMRVRGGEASDTRILVDGLPLPYAYHFSGGGGSASTLDTARVEEIQVHSGGFSVEFGDALAGVVDVTTRAARPDRTVGTVGLSTVRGTAALAGPAGPGAWSIATRASDLALYEDRAAVDGVDRVAFRDLQGDYRLELPGAGRLEVGLVRNDNAYTQSLGETERADASSAWRGGRLLLDQPFGGHGLVRLLAGEGSLSADSSVTGGAFMEQVQRRTDLRVALLWEGPAHEIRGGAEARHTRGVVAGEVSDGTTLLASRIEGGWWSGGAWFEDRWHPSARLSLRAGARGDRDSRDGGAALSPRASLEWSPADGWTVRVAAGRFTQFATQEQLFLAPGESFRLQSARHRVFGVERTLAGVLRIVVEGYDTTMRDPIGEAINLHPQLAEQLTQFETARTRGVELTVEDGGAGAWRWRASYGALAARQEKDGVVTPRDTDQAHAASVALGRSFGGGWSVSGLLRYGGGLPYTSETLTADGAGYRIEPGGLNAARLPAWYRVDLHLGRRVARRWGAVRFEIDLMNLTARRNVRSVGLEYDPDDATFYRITRYQTPFMPVFGVAAEF